MQVITISSNNREGREVTKVHIDSSCSHIQPWLRLGVHPAAKILATRMGARRIFSRGGQIRGSGDESPWRSLAVEHHGGLGAKPQKPMKNCENNA